MDDMDKKKYLLQIGNKIKDLRLQADISQDELAKRCGYTSRSAINKIEMGINDIPQSKVKAIADALNVSVNDILCWEEIENEQEKKQSIADLDILLDEDQKELLSLFNKLDQNDKLLIIGQIQGLLLQNKYKV